MRRLFQALALLLPLTLCVGVTHAAQGSAEVPDKIQPGDTPPDFLGKTLDAKDVRLQQYAGKAVVLSYWATWCPYCIKELPVLENIQRRVGKETMAVIAVNVEERDVFRSARRILKDTITFDLGYDPDGAARKAYGVNGLPHLVIIGRDGRVVRVWRGYDESALEGIAADLNAALAAPLKPQER